MCRVCACYRAGIVVMDVIWHRLGATSEVGKYLFRAVMCGGRVRSILLLPLVARCIETIYVCIWRMFVFMSVVVIVWGFVGMFVV